MYAKLFGSILDSSVWLEAEHTRIVWLTLLAAKDEDGFARFATVENLSARARVSLEKADEAVRILEAPDTNSSNPDHAGRRIERVPGGWLVLNAKIYDAIGKREHEREQTRERVRRHRARKPEPETQPPKDRPAPLSDDGIASGIEQRLSGEWGDRWSAVSDFLDTRSNRGAWLRELAKLDLDYAPEDIERACNDALMTTEPLRGAKGLRTFVASAKQERLTPPSDKRLPTDPVLGALDQWAKETAAKEAREAAK